MESQLIINALVMHLTETTIERDTARQELARTKEELTKFRQELAEIQAGTDQTEQ